MKPVFPGVAAPASVFVALLLSSTRAHALTFDASGRLTFEPNAVAKQSFDTAPAGTTLGTDVPLEGTGYVVVASNQNPLSLEVALPKAQGSYVARFFARRNRVVSSISVTYTEKAHPWFSADFYPTGRVTSDGWYEVATAPFSVDGVAAHTANLSIGASGADVDAFEVVSEGAYKALSKCGLPRDPVCDASAGEYCAADHCRNGNIQVPPLPKGADKRALEAYFQSRLRIFFGGRYTRENTLPVALATLAKTEEAKSAWEFWNGFATAIHQLHDWHTKTDAGVEIEGRGALPVCFIEGDGDLSHAEAPMDATLPDILVSHVGPQGNSGLKAGDRLVAVNGMHPVTFMETLEDLDWQYWRANDPETHAEAAERLRYAIRRWGRTLTIIRCNQNTLTCGPKQTLSVDDLPKVEPDAYPNCDHRPTYPVEGPNKDTHYVNKVFAGPVLGTDPGEGIYGVVWDSVYIASQNANNPYKPAMDLLRNSATAALLDHRTGNGGTEFAAEYLTQLFRTPATLGAATNFHTTVGFLDPPFTVSSGIALYDRLMDDGDPYNVGSASAKTQMKTALLLARDGSASDWFPHGMVGAGANVRVFGRRTAGAFSSYLQFDYFSNFRWQFGSGDYVRADGRTHLGEGVVPDEDILPKQSDLLVGRDTVVERALAWLRQ
ncbi:MAG: hypothetical protein U0174_10735 [Polyangiaceae bacterium]